MRTSVMQTTGRTEADAAHDGASTAPMTDRYRNAWPTLMIVVADAGRRSAFSAAACDVGHG